MRDRASTTGPSEQTRGQRRQDRCSKKSSINSWLMLHASSPRKKPSLGKRPMGLCKVGKRGRVPGAWAGFLSWPRRISHAPKQQTTDESINPFANFRFCQKSDFQNPVPESVSEVSYGILGSPGAPQTIQKEQRTTNKPRSWTTETCGDWVRWVHSKLAIMMNMSFD